MLLKHNISPSSQSPVARVIAAASSIILGKESQIRLALACMLARGHLLIEDLPGVGKTTLAHVLARTVGLQAGLSVPQPALCQPAPPVEKTFFARGYNNRAVRFEDKDQGEFDLP